MLGLTCFQVLLDKIFTYAFIFVMHTDISKLKSKKHLKYRYLVIACITNVNFNNVTRENR